MQKVMQSLYEENNQLLQSIDRLIEERNLANGKALIIEQMFDVAERQQLENSKEQEGKLQFLQQQLNEYQQIINQKTGNYVIEGQTNGVLNTVELQSIPINTQILQNQSLKSQITLQTQQDLEMKQIGKHFIKFREQQAEDLIRLQENMNNIHNNICQDCKKTIQNQKQSIIGVDQVVEFHRNLMNVNQQEILESEIEQRMLSPLASPLPDRVNYIQSPRTLPLLDLSKALKIQQINIKKHTDMEEKKLFKKQPEYLLNEIKKQKNILAETRNQLAIEMLLSKKLEIINDQLQRTINELESKEEILLFSQKLYEEKWKKIYHGYKFYRNYYKQHKDQMNHNTSRMHMDMSNYNDNMDSSRIIKENQRTQGFQQNKSIIDFNPDMDISQFNETQLIPQTQQYYNIQQNPQNDLQQDKQMTIQYLLTLAKGVYGTFNYQQQNHIQLKSRKNLQQSNRIQRSNSNPNIKVKSIQTNEIFSDNKSQILQSTNLNKSQYTQVKEQISPKKRVHRKNVSALLPNQNNNKQSNKYIDMDDQNDKSEDNIRVTHQKLDDSYDYGNKSSERYKIQFDATDKNTPIQSYSHLNNVQNSIQTDYKDKDNIRLNTDNDEINKSNNHNDKSYNQQFNQDLEIRGYKKQKSNINKNLNKQFELEPKKNQHSRSQKQLIGGGKNSEPLTLQISSSQKNIQEQEDFKIQKEKQLVAGFMQNEDLIQDAKPIKTEFIGDDISFDAQNKENFGSKNLDDLNDDNNDSSDLGVQNNGNPVIIKDFE